MPKEAIALGNGMAEKKITQAGLAFELSRRS